MDDVEVAAPLVEQPGDTQAERERLTECRGPHLPDLDHVDPVAILAQARGAERLGLADGAMARVTTRRGAAEAVGEVTDTLRPGHATPLVGLVVRRRFFRLVGHVLDGRGVVGIALRLRRGGVEPPLERRDRAAPPGWLPCMHEQHHPPPA